MPKHNSQQPKTGTSGSTRHQGPKTDRRERGKGEGRDSKLNRDVLVSKKVSYVLRHGAEKEGLKVDEKGFVNCADLLKWQVLRSLHVSFTELQHIVSTNSKQRFELTPIPIPIVPSLVSTSTLSPTSHAPQIRLPSVFSPLPQDVETDPFSSATAGLSISLDNAAPTEPILDPNEPSNFLIRATQGHSIKIASESLLLPVLESNLGSSTCPRYVVHGTTAPAWKKILATGGLSRMGRTHVHFASGLNSGPTSASTSTETTDPAATTEVNGEATDTQAPISGFRSSSTVLIWVDILKSLKTTKEEEKGLLWWRSTNGVILTEGDERGIVSLEWVDRVEERSPKNPSADRKVIWKSNPES